MANLELKFLGPFSAIYDDQQLDHFRTRAAQALLIYLACHSPQRIGREVLMAILWPELTPKSARSSLRHALYHLRRSIPEVTGTTGTPVPYVISDRESVGIHPDALFELDEAQFKSLSRPAATLAELEEAAVHYRGDFIVGFYLLGSANFENWAQARRADLQQRLLAVWARLSDGYSRDGRYEEAEQTIRRQLALDNLNEGAHRQLMTVLALQGRRAEALRHYDTLQATLRDELGIRPSAATEQTAVAIREGLIQPPTGLGLEAARKRKEVPMAHSLPAQATPFVGRRRELEALDALLSDPRVRLITVLGPGGVGKTRLAIAAAENQLAEQRFAHGVFFVPLAGLVDAERVIPAIAAAIQIRLEQGEKQLLGYLRNKRLLLILDNFEQLLSGHHVVSQLLTSAPGVQIMVTSRERLNLHAEHSLVVQGLAMEAAEDLDDASRLFLLAARRRRPNLAQSPEVLANIARIGKLVEGMPLALELAAAWVDTLTVDEVVKEIERSVDFLGSDLRDLPARHRSMRAVFEATWHGLSTRLQRMLSNMSVFEGGFTRDASFVVANADPRALTTLIGKSLLHFDPSARRYHVHELLRQYSLLELREPEVWQRHCDYYLGWLVNRIPWLIGAEQEETVDQISAELNNVDIAIVYAIETGRIHDLHLVADALTHVFIARGRAREGERLFRRMRTLLAETAPSSLRVRYWVTALEARLLGASTASQELWLECKRFLAELESTGEVLHREQAFARWEDGYIEYTSRPAKARVLLQDGYELALEAGDIWMAAQIQLTLARAARNQGDIPAAETAVAQGLLLFEQLGDLNSIIEAKLLLGNLAGIAGRYEEAEQLLLAGSAAARASRHPWQLANGGLTKLGMVYFYMGRFEDAFATIAEAQRVIADFSYAWGAAQTNLILGLLHLHLGAFQNAHVLGDEVVALARENGLEFFLCEGLILLAQAEIATGGLVLAEARLDEIDGLCASRPVGMPSYVAGRKMYRAVLGILKGDLVAARVVLRAELEDAIQRVGDLPLAHAVATLALLFAAEGKGDAARAIFTTTRKHRFVARSRWFADVIGARMPPAPQRTSADPIELSEPAGLYRELEEIATVTLRKWQ